jgi:hypothetical protein
MRTLVQWATEHQLRLRVSSVGLSQATKRKDEIRVINYAIHGENVCLKSFIVLPSQPLNACDSAVHRLLKEPNEHGIVKVNDRATQR